MHLSSTDPSRFSQQNEVGHLVEIREVLSSSQSSAVSQILPESLLGTQLLSSGGLGPR